MNKKMAREHSTLFNRSVKRERVRFFSLFPYFHKTFLERLDDTPQNSACNAKAVLRDATSCTLWQFCICMLRM